MTTILSLNQSISQMDEPTALTLIRGVRQRRLIMPEKTRQYMAAKREKSAKKEKAVVNVLQAMSQEDRLKLIKMLEDS
jgi:hypothetical protein